MATFEGHVGYEPGPTTQMFHPKFGALVTAALGTPKGPNLGGGGLAGLKPPPQRPNIGDIKGGKPAA